MYWIISQSAPLVREVWSFDFDDLVSLLLAVAALLGVVWVKRTKSETSAESASTSASVTATIDSDVLGRFLVLTEEVTSLRVQLQAATERIGKLEHDIQERTKLEEYLRGEIHARDEQIRELKGRVRHLEDVCRRAGINGEE